MKKSIMKRWVKALRSGKFKQGEGCLKRAGRYCCLGVLCEILKRELNLNEAVTNDGSATIFNGHTGILPKEVLYYSGIKDAQGRAQGISLTALNDSTDYTFTEIANIIEKNYENI